MNRPPPPVFPQFSLRGEGYNPLGSNVAKRLQGKNLFSASINKVGREQGFFLVRVFPPD